ncbi:hypothetical protein V7S57_12075 [Caulobacter sp. CCNWLY153]|nr:hypothetical protein [Caulobacter radicis]
METIVTLVPDPLLDLGAVSVRTRGGPDTMPEFSQEQPKTGLDPE